MIDNFNDFIKIQAICTYLKSFGYQAKVNTNTMVVEVQGLDKNTINICTWITAREFIHVRAQS